MSALPDHGTAYQRMCIHEQTGPAVSGTDTKAPFLYQNCMEMYCTDFQVNKHNKWLPIQRQNTRVDAILDLSGTNKPFLAKAMGTIPGLSDHDGIVLADILVKSQINKKPQRRVSVWSKANWDAMTSDTIAFSE